IRLFERSTHACSLAASRGKWLSWHVCASCSSPAMPSYATASGGARVTPLGLDFQHSCSPQTLASGQAALGLADLFASVPRVGLLAGDAMAAFVTAAGSGTVAFDGRALTRWRGDRVRDAEGVFFYLRDLDGGAVWSAGFEPTKQRPERYAAR